MLLSGHQTPPAVGASPGPLPPLSVPCMVVPSPTLGPFPLVYSPAVPGRVPAAPGPLPHAGPAPFGLSGLGSAAPLLIGPAAAGNPKPPPLPAADAPLQGPRALSLSPVTSRSLRVTQPESPVYRGHQASVAKPQQVSLRVRVSPAQGRRRAWGRAACVGSDFSPAAVGRGL